MLRKIIPLLALTFVGCREFRGESGLPADAEDQQDILFDFGEEEEDFLQEIQEMEEEIREIRERTRERNREIEEETREIQERRRRKWMIPLVLALCAISSWLGWLCWSALSEQESLGNGGRFCLSLASFFSLFASINFLISLCLALSRMLEV